MRQHSSEHPVGSLTSFNIIIIIIIANSPSFHDNITTNPDEPKTINLPSVLSLLEF